MRTGDQLLLGGVCYGSFTPLQQNINWAAICIQLFSVRDSPFAIDDTSWTGLKALGGKQWESGFICNVAFFSFRNQLSGLIVGNWVHVDTSCVCQAIRLFRGELSLTSDSRIVRQPGFYLHQACWRARHAFAFVSITG